MEWLVFSYSLPSKSRSSPRVTLWRRLGRLGAISPTGGLYVLPARDECVEAFQWLAQEIRHAQGEALVMRVAQFEGLTDEQLVALFNQARAQEYAEVDQAAVPLEKASRKLKQDQRAEVQDALARLRSRFNDITRVDYFGSPEAMRVGARLARIGDALSSASASPQVSRTAREEYRDKRWVTRPRPHVDRLACIWLIRRFINPNAVIRYATNPTPDEIGFDMNDGQFGHQGNLCTFETMLKAFGLDDPALQAMAEIVHEIDLRDGRYARPATLGVDQILQGWLFAGFSDAELEAHGIALYEGLYQALDPTHARSSKRKR
ncbi:MAG: chromate resistance protein ChrB domain-containing protein [Anaerolineae bacterium]